MTINPGVDVANPRSVLMIRRAGVLVATIFFMSLVPFAQENRQEISLQGAGFFTGSTSGNGTSYNTTQTGGFIGAYRYHLNHRVSVEGAYG